MRASRWAAIIVLVVVAGLALWGLIFYTSDGAVKADVVDKRCTLTGGSIVVETRMFNLRHTSQVDATSCSVVPVGAFVLYHLRSRHTIVYEHEGGDCLWDSVPPGCHGDRSTLW